MPAAQPPVAGHAGGAAAHGQGALGAHDLRVPRAKVARQAHAARAAAAAGGGDGKIKIFLKVVKICQIEGFFR